MKVKRGCAPRGVLTLCVDLSVAYHVASFTGGLYYQGLVGVVQLELRKPP